MSDYFKEIARFYRPSVPIDDPNLFFGRMHEKTLLYKTLVSPGRHAMIYGIRGIGKTSLITITTQILNLETNRPIINHTCSSQDNYASIVFSILHSCKLNISTNEEKNTRGGKISGEFKLPFIGGIGAKTEGNIESEITKGKLFDTHLSPAFFVNQLGGQNFIIILDEFDRISNRETISQIAETIKILSDTQSNTKIIIAGVAMNSNKLLNEHSSLIRNLVDIEVPLMSNEEISEIIKYGEKKLSISFDDDVFRLIVWLSDGLPYFAHLLSEELTTNAVIKGEKRVQILNFKEVIEQLYNIRACKDIKYDYDRLMSENKKTQFTLNPFTDEEYYPYQTWLKKTVLHAFSLVENKLENKQQKTLTNLTQYYHQFADRNEVKELKETDIDKILEYYSREQKFIEFVSSNNYGFIDNFHKTYVRLKTIQELNNNFTATNIAIWRGDE